MTKSPPGSGRVYLVGAGPGDPELLTRKAWRLLSEEAEVLVYDRLVSEEIVHIIPASVERIYAGKAPGHAHMTQEAINATLYAQASQGKTVLRLKGGDPFIFGRGGEEVAYLRARNIPCEVIPGITSAHGISALLQLPLTQRTLAHGVCFITGHQEQEVTAFPDFNHLAPTQTTLVIYMGLANIGTISSQLMQAGRSPNTPTIAIQQGTTPAQRVCAAPLDALAEEVKKAALTPPTLIIIGDVVAQSPFYIATHAA